VVVLGAAQVGMRRRRGGAFGGGQRLAVQTVLQDGLEALEAQAPDGQCPRRQAASRRSAPWSLPRRMMPRHDRLIYQELFQLLRAT
jgi:hypothetical protein